MSQPTAPSTPRPWSGRFAGSLHPQIARFNASIGFDIRLLPYDVAGSLAHVQMLGACGILSREEAEQIRQGLERIQKEVAEGIFQPDPEAEDVHYAVERRLVALVGEVGKKLHTGRSRNDQVATDLRLYLRDQIDAIRHFLWELRGVLLDLADQHVETLLPGYTHLQRAQPISLAHHLLAYEEMLWRDWQRLGRVREEINVCPLGSGALAGTSLPIDRQLVAHLLGFERISANSLDAVSDRDFLVEFHAAASLILVHLSRLSEEIILWATQEFGFVALTDACATGSSLMPQKKNPDVPELVRGKTGRVFGHLQALLVTLKGLPLAYNKDLQEDKEGLFDTVDTVKACLEAMTILLREGIQFQTQRMEAAVREDFSNATDVADYLVRRGIPFRSAHDLVGQIVRTCMAEGILLQDLPLERWKSFHPAFEADILAAIDPQRVVAARLSPGGTGFAVVREALQRAQARHQQAEPAEEPPPTRLSPGSGLPFEG
ncbi:argininosuccinate lyase [Synechococcus sp. H60.2]|uniref:argininosuccinate lyase n=1 Tax=Synechococcus sp. H60.2 TaxID=2964518 RepID=UPI0039C1B2CA